MMKIKIFAFAVTSQCLAASELRISFEEARPVAAIVAPGMDDGGVAICIYRSFEVAPKGDDFSYKATGSLSVSVSDANAPDVMEVSEEEYVLSAKELTRVQRFSEPIPVRRIDVFSDAAGCRLYVFAQKGIWKVLFQKGKEVRAELIKEDEVPRMERPLHMIKKASGGPPVFKQELGPNKTQ